MPNIVVNIIRKADNSLEFWGSYPTEEFSVTVSYVEDQVRQNGLSAGVHEEVAGEKKADA